MKLDELTKKRTGPHIDRSDSFWSLLVEYHRDRLEQEYVPNFRTRFEALHDNFRKPNDISWDEVDSIQGNSEEEIKITKSNYLECMGTSFDALKDLYHISKESSNPEQLRVIAIKAYEMRHSRQIKIYIQVCLGFSGMQKFLSSIYFLGRIRAAHKTLVTCAKAFPSFASVKAYLLLPPKAPTLEWAPELAHTMRLAALDYDLPTIRRHINSTIQLRALQEKFLDRQKDALKNLRVHAEIQILQLIQQTVEDLSDVFPYFGCSKLSCYLCSVVLKACSFETRGCHGRLYERWTIHHQSSLSDYASPRICLSTVMGATQDRIIEILQMPLSPMKTRVPESSAGYTIEVNPDVYTAGSLESYNRWLKSYKDYYLSNYASGTERALRRVRR
jgi:OTT_1508-like deaminase